MVVTLGQQYNTGEKLTVVLHTYDKLHSSLRVRELGSHWSMIIECAVRGGEQIIPRTYYIIRF